jgi:hypothetical protein
LDYLLPTFTGIGADRIQISIAFVLSPAQVLTDA